MRSMAQADLSGSQLGVYQVEALIGAGAMGEVYRARDTKLGRTVAIKVLPDSFTNDPERLARFEREARALAALNHPNIATIHGLEDFEPVQSTRGASVRGLVLELVEGETLADRIRNRLTHDQALRLARQIADALDAAHEKGIVHRDLKPANVRVTPEGAVKVVDFGLAKLIQPAESSLSSSSSPTMTSDGTREGVVVGTAAYMSPEQARGLPVDRRTDIWAFGCVLYEMLSGRAAFGRETTSDTVAAVLNSEPDWTALPEIVPPHLRRVLRRCLEKDVKRRARDIGDVRVELDDAAASLEALPAAAGRLSRFIGALPWGLAMLGLIAAVAIGVSVWSGRPARSSEAVVTRTTLTLPPGQEFDTAVGAGPLAFSQDGRHIAYVATAGGGTRLFVRHLDAFGADTLSGTDGAQFPFFSPDGESVAFFADRKLKRISIRGGSPLVVCEAPTTGRGGTWGADGTIVFDPGASGLMRVPAAGGVPQPVVSRDATMDRKDLSWPQFLPDGRGLIVTVAGKFVEDTLAVLALDTGEWHQLAPGSQPQYSPSGHLIYHAIGVREGELHAIPFDTTTLSLRGRPMAVVDNVFRAQNAGALFFAVAQNGTLIFTAGGYARTLVQVDRHGRRTPIVDDRLGFRGPVVSPDGGKVAVTIDPRPSQIWVYDLARRTRSAFATDHHSLTPLWTPDGRRIAYATGDPDLFWRAADAGSPAERLLARDGQQYPTSWSRDGKLLIFTDGLPNAFDIWMLPIGGQPRPLLATPASEWNAHLSPNDHWIAYQSNESGRLDVYVRPFPNVNDGKWTISTAGGQRPAWSPDGTELFYAAESAIMRVPVDTRGSRFVAGPPEQLFSGPFDLSYTSYAISKDATHFVMVEVDPNARPTQLNVVLNWAEEVKRTK